MLVSLEGYIDDSETLRFLSTWDVKRCEKVKFLVGIKFLPLKLVGLIFEPLTVWSNIMQCCNIMNDMSMITSAEAFGIDERPRPIHHADLSEFVYQQGVNLYWYVYLYVHKNHINIKLYLFFTHHIRVLSKTLNYIIFILHHEISWKII